MGAKPFTIAIVDGTVTFGGAFEIGMTLARHLCAIDGVRAHILSAQPPDVLERRAREGVALHSLPVPLWSYASPGLLGRGVSLARNLLGRELPTARRLVSLIRRLDVSVVHLNNALNPQMYGAIGARLAGVPCVCSYRGYTSSSRLVRRLEPLVDRHIPESEPIRQHLLEVARVPAAKIVPLHDPVDTDRFRPDIPPADLEGLFGIPRGRRVFSIFGRLVPWKGHEVFLRAARLVLEQVPDAHAMIVGDVSDGKPEFGDHLRRLAGELGIADRTTFTGYRTDVGALICASTVLVHASTEAEPFGMTVLEAMACGRPNVAMNEGGPAEMIVSGEHGVLVPPRQPEAMARAIVSILAAPDYAERLGRAARERAVAVFSGPVIARQFLEVYREVCAERGHRRGVGAAAGPGPSDAPARDAVGAPPR